RSYLDLSRRGHVSGSGIADLSRAYAELVAQGKSAAASGLGAMTSGLEDLRGAISPPVDRRVMPVDYRALVSGHNRRRRSPNTLNPRIVQDLADAARARHDVVDIVQPALFVPVRPRLGAKHGLRGEASIEAERVDAKVGVGGVHALDVLRRHNEVHRDAAR